MKHTRDPHLFPSCPKATSRITQRPWVERGSTPHDEDAPEHGAAVAPGYVKAHELELREQIVSLAEFEVLWELSPHEPGCADLLTPVVVDARLESADDEFDQERDFAKQGSWE